MKINYERLAEILEPYGLEVDGTVVKGFAFDDDEVDHEIVWLSLESGNIDKIAENVKNKTFASSWVTTIKVLVPILHPHYNEIFQPTINKEKLIEVFKKYAGWKVENNKIVIPYNHCYHLVKTYQIDDLINAYTNKDEVTSEGNIILSFMHHYENEFME